jgi:hypothetical protein
MEKRRERFKDDRDSPKRGDVLLQHLGMVSLHMTTPPKAPVGVRELLRSIVRKRVYTRTRWSCTRLHKLWCHERHPNSQPQRRRHR